MVVGAAAHARTPECRWRRRPDCHTLSVDISEIAEYRVIRPLGAGGMGQVFLVQHPRLPRRDALKLLDAGVSRNDDFKARFQREADLLAQLSHANIVTLHDRGEFEGRLWITMEYIEGTDAAELLKAGGPVDPRLAVQLVGGAGAALDYAWRKQRITHRDVKPANILVGIDGADGGSQIESVKLADFGIAKAAGESTSLTSTSLTSTGMTVGTMQYISPEAIEGLDVDNRSDLYSLGCTAFHLLAGRAPYSGNSIASIMSAHLSQDPPRISEVAPHLPAALDQVFVKVLGKNPGDRYASCGEFVAALQGAAGGEVAAFAPTLAAATLSSNAPTQVRRVELTPARRQSSKSRTVPIAVAVVAVLVVAAAVLGVWMTRGGSDEPMSPATGTAVTTTAAPTTTSVIAPPPPAPVTPTTSTTTSARTVVTTTVQAAPTPYEGMPCTPAEAGQQTPDGTLVCSMEAGGWADNTHTRRPAVQLGSPCSEPGARARVVQTDGLATCKAGPSGELAWLWS